MAKEENIEKDDLYQILERNIAWIENCDTKASIILGGIGIIIAILLSSDYVIQLKRIVNIMISKGTAGVLYIIMGVIALLTIIIGLFYLVLVLIAKTNTKEFRERGLKSNSLIFFSSIAQNKTFDDYKKKIENCSDISFRIDLISQISINSQICTKKFRNYKIGIILSMVGFISFSFILFLGVINL